MAIFVHIVDFLVIIFRFILNSVLSDSNTNLYPTKMKHLLLLFSLTLAFYSCNNTAEKQPSTPVTEDDEITYEAIGKLGDTLYAAEPSEEIMEKYLEKQRIYEEEPDDLDNLIWYGRFTAYLGNYRDAIEIYTKGLDKFPEESRLLRHRGHRYISVREFDKAIADLSKAAELIKDRENKTEPDGMPNAKNIPLSTMHGNIYYHLGLAHYLKNNMQAALDAYKMCLETSSSPDNVVSATHWIYMINRRMGRVDTAEKYLATIDKDMEVIENDAYHNACLMYKGELKPEDLYDPNSEDSASGSALKYAVGNWHYYNGDRELAKEIFREIVSGDDWASFGYIAAEADLARMQPAK